MMQLPSDLRSFAFSLKIWGLLPSDRFEDFGHKTSKKSHIYPIFMSIFAWINLFRFLTHLIWIPAFSVQQILFSGLLIGYMFVGALLRTLFSIAHFQNQGLVRSIQKLQEQKCPIWEEMAPHMEACRRRRSKVINMIHLFSWLFVIFNTSFLLGMGLVKQPSIRLMFAPFPQLNNDVAYYVGVLVVWILTLVSDTGGIFINTFIVAYTIELASKFDFITKLIEGNGTKRPGFFPDDNHQLEEQKMKPSLELDIENIRMAHLFWYQRVKDFDKLARVAIGLAMSIGFLCLLINMYLIIWGTDGRDMSIGHLAWAAFGLFFLFCHLLGSSHLNKTAANVTDAIFKVPTQVLFRQDNSIANFNILLFIGQCTSEPIALTFFDLFYLRNETVMAVSCTFKHLFF